MKYFRLLPNVVYTIEDDKGVIYDKSKKCKVLLSIDETLIINELIGFNQISDVEKRHGFLVELLVNKSINDGLACTYDK
jgi:hypothetical protein